MPNFSYQGNQIFYRLQGEGPLLVILPGNTASSACHQAELDHFSRSFTVASLDYLGTGQSDRISHLPEDWYGDCAQQTAALIEHLALGPAILMGTSGGSVVALRCAAAHSEWVKAVVADSFTPLFTPEMLEQNVLSERAHPTDDQAAFWQFANGEDWQQVVAADTQMLSDLTARGGQWLGDALPKITCAVLVTLSLEDPTLIDPARYGFEILGQLQNGRLFFSPKGGHPLMWSAPGEFRQAVQGFLAQFL
jgi:pimeloyl-ACP methyl ester carboxylesterase